MTARLFPGPDGLTGMQKHRLDVLLVERGLIGTRARAQRVILAGQVQADGQVAAKPGERFDPGVEIVVKEGPRFVSRGGDKLEAVFEAFDLCVEGLLCIDVGASTGGFTDCLLQHGAGHVIAVDVGKGQLAWKLRRDRRVTVLEGLNARYLSRSDLDGAPAFAVVDVSFISLTKVLPALNDVLAADAGIVTLIKPQFEAGREHVGKGGVVRDASVRKAVADRIRAFGTDEIGWTWRGATDSPISGPAGNVEILAYWRKGDRRVAAKKA